MKMKLNQSGFTLIEIVIAIALIGILAASFLSMFTAAYRYIFSNGRRSEAIFATEKQMESAIATGTTFETDILNLTFGSESLNIKGKNLQKNQVYDNGTRSVTMNSFLPKSSVSSGETVSPSTLPLEIYANELELLLWDTFVLEANKAVNWSSSNTSVATVTSGGLITSTGVGSATITATSLDGTESKTCIVTTVGSVTLRYVKGGQRVKYGANEYIKLTGDNGRVMELTLTATNVNWNKNNDMPFKGELEGDMWTNTLRAIAGSEYWTETEEGQGSSKQVYYVDSSGMLQKKDPSGGSKSGLRNTTALNPNLRVSTGAGTWGSPYILID